MKKSRLMDLVIAAAVTLGSIIAAAQAEAAVVCVGTTVATSCSGVEYNGTTYDVTWELPTYLNDSGYPSNGPALIVTTSTDAGALVDAINQGLNTGLFTGIQYTLTDGSTSSANACTQSCYYVPYEIFATTVGTAEGRFNGTSWVDTGVQYYNFATQNLRPVAVFTPSSVPVPAALPLFVSGMALVGWMGRRRRQGC